MPNSERLLTSTQAGVILGKSGRTVQRMAAKGELTPAQTLPGPNGAHLFRESDVRAYADAEQSRAA